jgi:hypothetical protein
MAAELAGMASIGIVHAQLANPTTAPLAELGEYFYAVAKLGLDTAIVYNPLRAVKLCTLIAMYNIIIHATVALAYLGKCDINCSFRRLLTCAKILVSFLLANLVSMLPSGAPFVFCRT